MKRLLLILLMASGVVAAQTDDIPVVSTDSTITQDTTSTTTTTLKSPPPSAVIPTMNNTNSDLCTVGVAGAVQTQILGISAGGSVRDMNCEKLKNAKVLYDMGMKVAAVSVMCQDKRVFDAMMMAGTPCPYDGMIGLDAKAAWTANEEVQPVEEETQGSLDEVTKKTLLGLSGVASLLIMLVVL